MEVSRLTPDQTATSALGSLGLSEVGVDLLSTEALAASLRRAASFLCPATPGQIVRSVMEVLEGLPGYTDATQPELETLLETLVGYGDLLELSVDGLGSGRTRLFLGAPAYVQRSSGACLLVGIRPDGAQLVGDELAAAIDYEAHTRLVPPSESLDSFLTASGLVRLTSAQWLIRAPRQVEARYLVGEYDLRLEASGPSGSIEGSRILDSTAPVTYYRGRWRPPKASDNGTFVVRRPQAFGADLWCYALLADGEIVQLVDLPLLESIAPGADEAWRLQAALDALAGHPQQVRLRQGSETSQVVLDLFGPVPSWAQRRLDVVGTPLQRGRGALFSYCLPAEEAAEELQFLADMQWIAADKQPERTES
jgi:hypothetical protein